MEDRVRSDVGLVEKKNSCSVVVKKKKEGNSGSDKKKRPRLVLSDSESSEDSFEYKKIVSENNSVRNGVNESERKRRLDVFEFDEYDNIDEKRLKRERELGHGSSSIETSKHFDKTINFSKGRLKIEDDDDDFLISSLRQKVRSPPPKEAIRLQGKNGVLKVMVNKNKKMEVHEKHNDRKLEVEDVKVPKSEKIIKKNKSVGSSFYSESKVKLEKRELKSGKSTISEAPNSLKRVEIERKAQSAKRITPVKVSKGKVNRGAGTEKQLLREKLKNILTDAGWKIDYRPRKSRDYLDAVYISPTGTAYWSIVKAYDAFQKHKDDDAEVEPSSLAEDIMKLTRKTQKRIEREMKMKQREKKRNKISKRVSSEESAEDEDSDEDEDDEESLPVKKNCESLKKNNPLKKKKVDDRKSRKLGRGTLLVRSSDKGFNSDNEVYIAYTGKRTLLSWLIDCGTVNSSEKVKYMNRRQTRVMLEGWVTRDGIHCSCCSKVISVSKFEIHAGSKLRQPYQNIYLESGVSLFQCQVDAWNRQEISDRSGFHNVNIDGDDPNDDTCGLCGDGGDLMCCDGCPSTFHQSCLDIKMLPSGDWHCPNCTCKFCGIGGSPTADENGTNVDVMHPCGLCEKKFHESCGQKVDAPSNISRSSTSFCGPECNEIFDHLQKLLGVKHELDTGFTWSLIHRTDLKSDVSRRSFPARVETNSKLAVALSVMDECFLPIVDRRSGINLVNSVLYNCGSNFSRLNYSGFYTVILERGDEIVAASSIRIRGTQLAEMPFIGTRHMYRRQGMCRRLLGAIESVLASLKVEKLTIPAIAEHMHTWTAIFGFKPLDETHKHELRSTNLVVFPGVDMLQKFIVKQKTTEGEEAANSVPGGETIFPKDNHFLTPDVRKKSDVDTCTDHVLQTSDHDATLHNDSVMSEKSVVVEPSLQDSSAPLNVNTTREINVGENPISPSSLPGEEAFDGNTTTDSNKLDSLSRSSPHRNEDPNTGPVTDLNLNEIDAVSPSSPHCNDQTDAEPMTDSNQLNAREKEIKVNEAVKISDQMILSESKADIGDNIASHLTKSYGCDTLYTVSEVVHCKTAEDPSIDARDSSATEDLNDNVNHVHVSTQNGADGKNEFVYEEMESHVDSVVSSEIEVKTVKLHSHPSADCDLLDDHIGNGKISCVEPGLDCLEEKPSQNNDVDGDEVPLSVIGTNNKETNLNLTFEAVDETGKFSQKVSSLGAFAQPILEYSSAESTIEDLKENNAV